MAFYKEKSAPWKNLCGILFYNYKKGCARFVPFPLLFFPRKAHFLSPGRRRRCEVIMQREEKGTQCQQSFTVAILTFFACSVFLAYMQKSNMHFATSDEQEKRDTFCCQCEKGISWKCSCKKKNEVGGRETGPYNPCNDCFKARHIFYCLLVLRTLQQTKSAQLEICMKMHFLGKIGLTFLQCLIKKGHSVGCIFSCTKVQSFVISCTCEKTIRIVFTLSNRELRELR